MISLFVTHVHGYSNLHENNCIVSVEHQGTRSMVNVSTHTTGPAALVAHHLARGLWWGLVALCLVLAATLLEVSEYQLTSMESVP